MSETRRPLTLDQRLINFIGSSLLTTLQLQTMIEELEWKLASSRPAGPEESNGAV